MAGRQRYDADAALMPGAGRPADLFATPMRDGEADAIADAAHVPTPA